MILRRRMMGGGGVVTPKYTLKSVTSAGGTTLVLGLDYTPALVCTWSTYRFSHSDYGGSARNIHTMLDSGTGGNFAAKTTSTSSATPAWSKAWLNSSGNLVCSSTYTFVNGWEYKVLALSADAITHGVSGHVYVEEFTGNNTKSYTSQCPFTPDVWVCYNLTAFTNKAVPSQTYSQVSRITDNLNLGRYNTARAGGSNFDNLSPGVLSEVSDGKTVPANQNYRTTNTFRFIAVKL